jgi:tRNA nucleotidyltransferase (CCA-adding enzyme)
MKGMDDSLRAEAIEVLNTLQQYGHEAYFVGGCVRDLLLKRPIHDIDIATSALPEDVMNCFARTAPTGLQHGTVTVILAHHTFEVTTFRTESSYEGYRRPTEVRYIPDLRGDLERRDFTMNAMAMTRQGEVIDPFGGRTDLAAGRLRCVGAAADRFGEDALRMLRCVRFAAEYGLLVEEATWAALLGQAPLLRHIAQERVRAELARMVGGSAPHKAIRLLLDSRMLRHFKRPAELPLEAVWGSAFAKAALPELTALQPEAARWVVLLLLTGAASEEVRKVLRAWTFSRDAIQGIAGSMELFERLRQSSMLAAAKLSSVSHLPVAAQKLSAVKPPKDPHDVLRDVWKLEAISSGMEHAERLLAALRPLYKHLALASECEEHRHLAFFLNDWGNLLLDKGAEWLYELPCKSVKELLIDGHALTRHFGRTGGPWTGNVLQCLLQQVTLGHLPNERSELLKAAENFVNECKN